MTTLDEFLQPWEVDYRGALATVPLLQTETAINLSKQQRKYFAELFWHVRGHFSEFLWALANKAPYASRQMIVDNIKDELGARDKHHTPHDVLYNRFAAALGADTAEYLLRHSPYPAWLQDYNQTHLKFLLRESWPVCAAAFSAYEFLDNADYGAVEQLGKVWELDRTALEFFEVHRRSDHFNEVSGDLSAIWGNDPRAIEKGFTFIAQHQLKMWYNLSHAVLNH